MARSAIPVLAANDIGAASTWTVPDALGGIIPPNAVLVLFNLSAGSITVTVQTPAGAGVPTGLDLSDRTLVVAAGGIGVIGPFPPEFYARPSAPDAGQVYVDFSSVVNLVVAALRDRQ